MLPAGTGCRASTDECDLDDVCDGSGPVCADDVAPAGTSCGALASDVCDADDACDGAAKSCPDVLQPTTEVCRPAVDVCDVPDHCDGNGTACPSDELQTSSFTCRPAAALCDVAEQCTGGDTACPTDVLRPASFVCRPVAGQCDVADQCTGSDPTCPDDQYVTDGTMCVGANPNMCLNACNAGSCTNGQAVTPQGCCGNGILDLGETCDDGNQISGDTCPSLPGDDCHFAGTGSLVRASRKKPSSDSLGCQLEFAVTNASSSPDRYDLASWIQVCVDQDPACDFDPTPGRCRFAVAACLNNDDPNLPACAPSGVGSVNITPPRRTLPPDQLELASEGVAKLTAGLEQLLDPANPQAWYSNTLPVSADQRNLCTSTFLVDVLAGSDYKAAKRKAFSLKVRSNDLNGIKKLSKLRLLCQQAPPP
jgi:cysteine-rich repeat protein